MSVARSETVPEIKALTGLRLVAVTLVFASHAYDPALHLPAWLGTMMLAGSNGVTLFFVLSGFVICYNYHDRLAADFRSNVGPFFLARFARIYPLYFLLLIWTASFTNFARQWQAGMWVFIQHLTMIQPWNRNLLQVYIYNPVGWSVGVEVFFYLLFPLFSVLILRHLRQTRQLVLLGVCAAMCGLGIATYFSLTGNVALRGDNHYVLYRLPLTRFADFALGCVVARLFWLHRDTPISRRERRVAGAIFIAALLITIAVMLASRPWAVPFRFGPGYSLPFAAIIFCIARYGMTPGRVLASRPIVLMGAASYSFYLLHLNLLVMMHIDPGVAGQKTAYIHLALAYLLIWVAALGMFGAVETPLRRWIRERVPRAFTAARRALRVPRTVATPAAAPETAPGEPSIPNVAAFSE